MQSMVEGAPREHDDRVGRTVRVGKYTRRSDTNQADVILLQKLVAFHVAVGSRASVMGLAVDLDD